MTRIVKNYWEWDDSLNLTEFKLGRNIDELSQKKIVTQNQENLNEYFGNHKNPLKIDVCDGKIISIWYSSYEGSIFPFIIDNLWDMEENKFRNTLNFILKPTMPPLKGDVLYVVFRGGFVTFAGLLRR